MEITLDDLMILEPRLVPAGGHSRTLDAARNDDRAAVSWAVSARTSAPHLPLLRGGEILLVSSRVATAVGADFPALLREATRHGVSAFVFEFGDPSARLGEPAVESVPRLSWSGELAADSETTINRLLTETRGNLYRIGTELERQLAEFSVKGGGIAVLVTLAAATSGLPLAVFDSRSRRLAAAPDDNLVECASPHPHESGLVCRALSYGATLVVGPLSPPQRLLARFLIDRVVAAANLALQRDESARPRGVRRAAAVRALLTRNHQRSSDQRAAALALGFDPDGLFLVAITSESGETGNARYLSALGAVHPAGDLDGHHLALIAVNRHGEADSLAARVLDVKQRWNATHQGKGSTLALSAPAIGVASLPRAAEEAQFVATLQKRERFPRRAASFDSIEDVGEMRLLYQLRDSNELRQFVADVLGTLEKRDRRGTLHETLREFLESGGSHVDASTKLGIHRNTLSYRLRRIGELVGKDVADPGTWLALHLALRASEMLDVQSDER
jgi:purine catabolism regulator